MALLEADKVARFFLSGNNSSPALQEVSLTVQPGEFLVITGPSGSGKSTLLNLLGGLDRPSRGEVRYKGQSLAAMSEGQVALLRNISFGFIFQTPHLLVDRTVAENVTLPFHYGKPITPGEMQRRCQELLRYVDMADMAGRYPDTLSGGEMQRVVFARALVRKPPLIFADEPTGSLDAGNSERIMKLLQEQTRQGCTVVMVSHDPEAVQYGSRVIRLEKIHSLR
ncbi:MAG: hypothetical protein ACD_75C01882G0002 [uncultured bacterium]|nr:MAG: hypothetical protein ACD_75C01882G0002 [uncultured bacterium]